MKDILAPVAEHAHQATDTAAPGGWIWSQQWINLLFLHWQVPADLLSPHVPNGVTIDTYHERAWVSLVLFRLKVRPRWLPFVPGISTMNEMNLRTYVTGRDQPGICFLSMHANNRPAIRLARWLTPLPYFPARIRYETAPAGYSFDCAAAQPDCRLSVRFSPRGNTRCPKKGSLDAWLLERYRLFISARSQQLMTAEVAHPRWSVRAARATIAANTIGAPFGLVLSRAADLAHFSTGVAAQFGAFQRCPEPGRQL